ncbi:hypothetical protein [Acetobacter sp. P1H12_c]|uniref:hypothetical protein n=1 Tax=Acetobacter sp. P1H12_c TaxID=2762621 RepID=UPI001C03B007|nr:hypothetical protein [Acetobacter sp. P1H12_c]
MTQKTKLEIIGPYTPEHPGPYIIDSAMSSDVRLVQVTVHCIVDGVAFVTTEDRDGPWCARTSDLMNAREVPVAREFWVNEYAGGGLSLAHPSLGRAAANRRTDGSFIRTIHLREVLPGDEA